MIRCLDYIRTYAFRRMIYCVILYHILMNPVRTIWTPRFCYHIYIIRILYCIIYIIGLIITGTRHVFVPHLRHENVTIEVVLPRQLHYDLRHLLHPWCHHAA